MDATLLARLAAAADVDLDAIGEEAFARIVQTVAEHCAQAADACGRGTATSLKDPRFRPGSPQHALVRGGVMQAEKIAQAIRAVFTSSR